MSKNLVEEVIRVLEEEYFNPFSILIVEECFFNLSSGIPVNNLLDDEILQTEELGKKLALAFATKRLVENGGKKFHEVLPKTKLPSLKNTARSVTVQKNNKQRIVQVNRDILSWLIHLSAGRRLVANYEMAMEYPLSPMPLSIATTEGGRRQTAKRKLLEFVTATLTTPLNSPKLVTSVDPGKSSTLIIDFIAAIRTIAKIPETYRQLTKVVSTMQYI